MAPVRCPVRGVRLVGLDGRELQLYELRHRERRSIQSE